MLTARELLLFLCGDSFDDELRNLPAFDHVAVGHAHAPGGNRSQRKFWTIGKAKLTDNKYVQRHFQSLRHLERNRYAAARERQNQHVIVITDGQPTAYFLTGRLYCEWPLSFGGISMRAAQETLKEVERVTRRGIVINTFMLDDSPSLRAFVERMTRINKGRALYTRPDRLGQYLLVDYLAKKKKRV